jgi:hypothetical protein
MTVDGNTEEGEEAKIEMNDDYQRKRLAEEMAKIQLETAQKRKEAQRALIGSAAEDVGKRKQQVGESVQRWCEKGKTHAELPSINVASAEQVAERIKAYKQAYADNFERNANKGKHEVISQGNQLSEEQRKKFDDPSYVPTIFGGGGDSNNQSVADDDSPASPQEDLYKSEFASIDSEEVKMFGLEQHIRITGIDHHGRKLTKTKIILPKVQGGTVNQGQHNKPTNSNPKNKLEPANWDGEYHSLVDIRQRRVEGIDKNYREQYLSPEDFHEVFKMDKEAFMKLPKWKRDKMKRDMHLF